MALLDRGDKYEPLKVGNKINDMLAGVDDEDESLMQARRLSAEATKILAAAGVNATSAEAAITCNGLAVGDVVEGIVMINTTNCVMPTTSYRDTCLVVNTVNGIVGHNTAGQVMVVHALNRAAL